MNNLSVQCRLDGFLHMQSTGKLGSDERLVLDLLEAHPAGLTDSQMSELFKADHIKNGLSTPFKWEEGRVSARRRGLVKKGKVFAARKKINIYTMVPNTVWVACVYRQLYEGMGFEEEIAPISKTVSPLVSSSIIDPWSDDLLKDKTSEVGKQW